MNKVWTEWATSLACYSYMVRKIYQCLAKLYNPLFSSSQCTNSFHRLSSSLQMKDISCSHPEVNSKWPVTNVRTDPFPVFFFWSKKSEQFWVDPVKAMLTRQSLVLSMLSHQLKVASVHNIDTKWVNSSTDHGTTG